MNSHHSLPLTEPPDCSCASLCIESPFRMTAHKTSKVPRCDICGTETARELYNAKDRLSNSSDEYTIADIAIGRRRHRLERLLQTFRIAEVRHALRMGIEERFDALVAVFFLVLVAAIVLGSARQWWQLVRGSKRIVLHENEFVPITPAQLAQF